MTQSTPLNRELKKEIHHQLYLYRVKCDIALSDRDEGVITQKEYAEATKWQGEINTNQIITLTLKAFADEVESKFKEIDFDTAAKRLEDYNKLADYKDIRGYCMVCGHSPKDLKNWLDESLKDTLNKWISEKD